MWLQLCDYELTHCHCVLFGSQSLGPLHLNSSKACVVLSKRSWEAGRIYVGNVFTWTSSFGWIFMLIYLFFGSSTMLFNRVCTSLWFSPPTDYH